MYNLARTCVKSRFPRLGASIPPLDGFLHDTVTVCKFLIEDIICRYGCVGKIVADRGELDAEEAEELFDRLGVKLSRTTAYNPEANGKIKWGHGAIIKAIVRACEGRVGNWPRLLPYTVALLSACMEKGGTTGVLDQEEKEARHRPSLVQPCWARL